MTEKEILEYNKKCAEFLGFKYKNQSKFWAIYPLDNNSYLRQLGYVRMDNLKFHSDWNWIMEVVEAIEKKSKHTIINRDLYDSFDIGNRHIKFYFSPNNEYLLQLELKQFVPDESWIHTMYKHRIIKQFDFKTKGKKEAVVEAINQFLIWYKESK